MQANLIIGTGGIGSALVKALPGAETIAISRATHPGFDICDEASIATLANQLRPHAPFQRIIIATGALVINNAGPEKRLADIDPAIMARAFALNAIGPALIIKHCADLLPPAGRCVLAALSARVGSITDNHLGGWYAYRASKAALNQLIHTASIEIARKRPQAVVLALHPGTVRTRLSAPFTKPTQGITPEECATRLLEVMDTAQNTGTFLDYAGCEIPW